MPATRQLAKTVGPMSFFDIPLSFFEGITPPPPNKSLGRLGKWVGTNRKKILEVSCDYKRSSEIFFEVSGEHKFPSFAPPQQKTLATPLILSSVDIKLLYTTTPLYCRTLILKNNNKKRHISLNIIITIGLSHYHGADRYNKVMDITSYYELYIAQLPFFHLILISPPPPLRFQYLLASSRHKYIAEWLTVTTDSDQTAAEAVLSLWIADRQ